MSNVTPRISRNILLTKGIRGLKVEPTKYNVLSFEERGRDDYQGNECSCI